MTHYVFGYGSLIWRPDFPFISREKAKIYGYHRALCVKSTHHRGTKERTGLVMGLDKGGSCVGVVYGVADDKWAEVYTYLHAREMISYVYAEKYLETITETSRVKSLVYCVQQDHQQYQGKLSFEEQVSRVKGAEGISGKNVDYVLETVKALQNLAIRDKALEKIAKALKSA